MKIYKSVHQLYEKKNTSIHLSSGRICQAGNSGPARKCHRYILFKRRYVIQGRRDNKGIEYCTIQFYQYFITSFTHISKQKLGAFKVLSTVTRL